MDRRELHTIVKEAMHKEYADRNVHQGMTPDQREKMAGMYAEIGSNLFIYDLLDTPGVLDAVLEYIHS